MAQNENRESVAVYQDGEKVYNDAEEIIGCSKVKDLSSILIA